MDSDEGERMRKGEIAPQRGIFDFVAEERLPRPAARAQELHLHLRSSTMTGGRVPRVPG